MFIVFLNRKYQKIYKEWQKRNEAEIADEVTHQAHINELYYRIIQHLKRIYI